jgi:D-3-phosphoglycerate dehydrogenase
VAAATSRGIAVVVTPGTGAIAVAEGAIAMAMHLVKRFGRLTDLVRAGRWADRGSVAVGDLAGSTLGVVGYGRIGRHAGALGAALGMKVLAYDPFAEPPVELRCDTLTDLLSHSDVITLHLPLTPETHHLISAETLGMTKPGAILVNCGRGSLIDNDAAYQALLAGQIAGVGLDVFDPEPPQHHPLFDHPDVVLTPHLMGLSSRATAATFTAAATGVVDVLEGREPMAVADPLWNRDGAPHGSTVAFTGGPR